MTFIMFLYLFSFYVCGMIKYEQIQDDAIVHSRFITDCLLNGSRYVEIKKDNILMMRKEVKLNIFHVLPKINQPYFNN